MSRDNSSLFTKLFKTDPDEVIVKGKPPAVEPAEETGMDRLKTIFALDEYGRSSKEITTIIQGTSAATFVGGLLGSMIQSRGTYVNFLEHNQATKFGSHIEAKRELARAMYLAFGKGFFRWGWRIGGFTFSYISLLTVTSLYFGKESLLDFIIAGGVTGGTFRAHLGMKGVISGSIIGSALGTVAGAASLLVLKAGGMSMSELREFTKDIRDLRDDKIRQNIKNQMAKDYTDFVNTSLGDGTVDNIDTGDE